MFSKIIEYIDNNFTTQITLKSLGAKFFVNHIYLGQLIKKHTGQTFNCYINNKRMQTAASIIKTSDKVVLKELALSLGFSDSHYFAKQFKDYYGITASEYKQSLPSGTLH